MLTYGTLRAMRQRPDRRPRSARQIALAARASGRDEQRQARSRRIGRRR